MTFWTSVFNLFFAPFRWAIDSLLSIELGGVSLISILVAFTVVSVVLVGLVYGVSRVGGNIGNENYARQKQAERDVELDARWAARRHYYSSRRK